MVVNDFFCFKDGLGFCKVDIVYGICALNEVGQIITHQCNVNVF